MSECPKCHAKSQRLCDINPLSNETILVSPFIIFETNNHREKLCQNCGYEEIE